MLEGNTTMEKMLLFAGVLIPGLALAPSATMAGCYQVCSSYAFDGRCSFSSMRCDPPAPIVRTCTKQCALWNYQTYQCIYYKDVCRVPPGTGAASSSDRIINQYR